MYFQPSKFTKKSSLVHPALFIRYVHPSCLHQGGSVTLPRANTVLFLCAPSKRDPTSRSLSLIIHYYRLSNSHIDIKLPDTGVNCANKRQETSKLKWLNNPDSAIYSLCHSYLSHIKRLLFSPQWECGSSFYCFLLAKWECSHSSKFTTEPECGLYIKL